jgi:tripartite-type tricarboxylate transporter receptor subunit TctC
MKRLLCTKRLSIFLCLGLALFWVKSAYPQQEDVAKYPSRPITLIIPLLAGAPGDIAARLISKDAERILGQPIVPANKPGGATSIGVAAIAKAKPDGYTIGYGAHSGVFIGPLLEKLPYHPLKDLKPIIQFGNSLFSVSVRTDSPFKSFKDLTSYARQNPKKLTYASTGTTSMQYFVVNQVFKKEKLEVTHIPFKGSPEGHVSLLGGHIDFIVDTIVYPLVEAGKERTLLILNDQRAEEFPNIPILKDLGYDIPTPMILNIMGPTGIPDGIIKKLEDAFTKAMKEPGFIKGMKENLRFPIFYRNSRDLSEYVTRGFETYEKILKEMGLVK